MNSQRKRLQLGTLDLAAKLARERLAEGTITQSVYHPVLTSNVYCTGTELWDLSKFEERVEYWYRLTMYLRFNTSVVKMEDDLWVHDETMRIKRKRGSVGGNTSTFAFNLWVHDETMRIERDRGSVGGNAPTRMNPLLARLVHVKAKFITALLDSAYENGLSIDTGKRLTAQVYT